AGLIRAVKKLGVDKKDIQTGYIQIEPRHEKRYEQKGFAGYFVKNTVTIKIRDVGSFEEILSAVVTRKIDRVNGISFSSSRKKEFEKKAALDAVKNAKTKASQLASEIGQSIGPAVNIRESRIFYKSADYRPAGVLRMSESSGGQSSFEPGEIIISAEIHAEFILNK
ncbi:MAG: SIMPL domain-containing protein, partial [bacterium]